MILIVVVVVISVLIFLLHQFKYHRRDVLLSKIPSPKKKIFLHNLLELVGLTPYEMFKKVELLHGDLGEVFQFTVHPFDDGTVVIVDPKIAETLLFHQPDRSRSALYKALSRWIGTDGFFLAAENIARVRMKAITNFLNPKMYEKLIGVANRHLNEFVKIIDGCPGTDADYFLMSRNLVIDIVFDQILQINLNSKHGSNKIYVNSIERFCELAMFSTLSIFSRIGLHRFTNLYREENKSLKILHDFTRKIVKDRRQELSEGGGGKDWLILEHYLQTPIEGKFLTDEEIRAEIDTMIFGAHDTSKTTTAFALYTAARYPEMQQKLYEEAMPLMKDDLTRDIGDEDLRQLKYVDAFVKETLRLYPPIPFLARKLRSEVSAGGYTFPKDVDVCISPYLMGRNPKYFDDPLVFNPDRFLGVDVPPAGYIPFSTGARKCPGGKFAIIAIKIGVAKLIANFKFSLRDNSPDMEVFADLILKPKNGIFLRAERRGDSTRANE